MEEQTGSIIKNPNLQIIFMITLLAVLGVSSIAPALPLMVKEFHVKPGQIGMLITVFTLPGIVLNPVTGILADRFGRKTIIVPSLMLFGISGFLCTFTRNYEMLLILRFFQGLGAASLGSINVTLIGDIFSGNRRAAAMGYNASVLSIGTASYPAIGGALALAGWYYPFVLPLLAIPAGLIVLFRLKNPEPEAFISFKNYFHNIWKNINQRKVWGIFIINIMAFFVTYGTILTYFPIHLENSFHLSSLAIGMVMSSMSLTTAISSSTTGYLNRRFSSRKLLLFSFLNYALAMTLIPFSKHLIFIVMISLLGGLSYGVTMPNIQTIMVGISPLKERAAFMSINSMVLRIGQTLGPLFMGFIYGLAGTGATFFAAAGIALIMFSITFLVIK